ncbi:alpha/beta hydrolase [Massilia sp. TWP1-3-3]|uniref:alpha/beta hydrolase n=1 Tax=Massilia sp. TWP1-3-3 TaxID=2804573 RepID=UPI003CECE521
MNQRAKRGAVAFACLSVLAAGAVFGAGEYLSAAARHPVGAPPATLFATPVVIPSAQGDVAGWVARGAGHGAVLLLHGVRSDRRQMQDRALFLNRLGYSVLLIDLASHGESEGKRITFGAHEAHSVRAALAYLRRGLPGEKIAVIGVSLGAASVVLSTPGQGIDALVVESMYPTIDEAVENRLAARLGPAGRWAAPLLLQQIPLRTDVSLAALRPVEAMARVTCPVFVIGGAADVQTPAGETRRIFAAANQPKQLWIVDGAAHVDLHGYAGDEYERRVGQFLGRYLGRKPFMQGLAQSEK